MGNCIRSLDTWIWANCEHMLSNDHCKPAPWISHKWLLALRVSIALTLFAQSIATIVVTEWDTFAFFSEWQLYMSTVLFTLLAYSQVTNQIKLNSFQLTVDDDEIRTQGWDEEFGTVPSAPKSLNMWKWIMLLYLTSFSFSIMDSIVYWTVEGLDIDPDFVNFSQGEMLILYLLHTIPIVLLLIEYPFNMIPINLRLFPFGLAIMLIYVLVTLLY